MNTDTSQQQQQQQQQAPQKFLNRVLYLGLDFLSVWEKSSLKSRLTFVQTIILVASIAAILLAGITLYKKDKLSYVYENHYLKTSAVATRLKLYFYNLPHEEIMTVKPQDETKVAAKYGLPQLPADSQMFIGFDGTDAFVFGREGGEKIWRSRLDPNTQLFNGIDGKSYIATSFGKFISSHNRDEINAQSFKGRVGTQKFIKSGLSEGFTKYTDGENEWIISFKEIPDTNVIAFVETSLASLNAPIKKFYQYALILALVLVGLVIMVTDFLLLGLLKPLREIVNAMFKVSAGHYDIEFNAKFDEELSFVARGLQQMAKRLKIREGELKQISANLEFVMKVTKEMSLAPHRDACMQTLIKQIRGYVQFKPIMDASAVVFELGSNTPKGVIDYVTLGSPVDELKILSLEAAGVEMEELESSDSVNMMGNTIVLRAFAGEELKMILMLDGFPEDQLTTIELHLMTLLAASLGHALVMFDFQEERLATAHFENELVTAQAVQTALLPSSRPVMNADLEFYYEAATRCGGDWLFFDKSEDSPWLHGLVGDVTGHGVPAAIMTGVAYGSFMGAQAVMETLRASESMGETDRLQFMAAILNRAILSVGKSARLMTMCLVTLNTETGELYYASAGHTPLLWYRTKTKKISPQTSTGNPLGVSLDRPITVKKIQLDEGDLFALFTDGLLENHGPKNEMMAKRRFYDILASQKHVGDICNQIMDEAKAIWQDEEYADDVTMLIVRWPASGQVRTDNNDDALRAAQLAEGKSTTPAA
jgi:serine phosphatase RsbU (regulator of sigma subunit)/HAMP domain-containing protein